MSDSQTGKNSPTAAPGGATTTPTSSALGQMVDGRYRIVQPLAAGGMGSVYLAEQDTLRRRVAIKRVSQPETDSAERFRREAEALAAVSHPAIVEVFDYVNDPEAQVSYLVMAYVAGENVADYVAKRSDGVLSPLESVELLLPVASALVELHSHDILHRDIKPANLVRYERADGRSAVKLVDFGIARRAQDPGLTAEGLIVGTPPYLSPEVILGKGHSEASDVFAFGATLFELLTGTPPHGRDDLHQILKRATQGDVKLPPELEYSPLGQLLMGTLAKDDAMRPRMQAVLEGLERIQLSLLQESGSHDAALVATRAATPSTLAEPLPPPGRTEPPREAATVELDQAQAAAPAARSDEGTALVAGAPPDRTTDAVKVSPPSAAPARSSAAPWIVAGGAVAVAIDVTLFFSLRSPSRSDREGSDDKKTAQASQTTTKAPEKRRAARTADRRVRPRAAAPMARRKVTADLRKTYLAECSINISKATALYFKARRWRQIPSYHARAKAIFAALIDCSKANDTQRMWSAYYLTRLHAAAGECAGVDRSWTRYLKIPGKGRNRALRKPPCKSR